MEYDNFNSMINKSINSLVKDAVRVSIKNPGMLKFLLKSLLKQKRAARLREENEKLGIHVPPFMIASITHKCNLKCKGCYAKAQHRGNNAEMNSDKLEGVLKEADELGISIVLLAGGEPLVREQEIFQITKKFPQIIFPMFTNGMLIDNDAIEALSVQRNIVPVISIEGHEEDTDLRRGEGTYKRIIKLLEEFKNKDIFYGVSITMTSRNYDVVSSEEFIKDLINKGNKLFFYVEYVPVKEGTEDLILSEEQRMYIPALMDSLRSRFQSLFIAFPGDEEALGGCLAAGRGFVHVSPEGNLEPCPFVPFSDTNLKDKSLKEALKSDFLRKIRQNHQLLTEEHGGCALWENREFVEALLKGDVN